MLMTTKPKIIRSDRLNDLINSRFGGKQSVFADKVGISPSLVSRYLKGKGIGEDMKRKIEDSCNLCKDWLDGVEYNPIEEQEDDIELIALMRMIRQLPKESRSLAKSQLNAIIEFSSERDCVEKDCNKTGNGNGN